MRSRWRSVASFTTVWAVTTSTPRGSTRVMARCTVALSAPGCVTTSMSLNLTHIAKERLRGRGVEGGERRPGQVAGRAEARNAGDGERLGGAFEQDPDALTHLEAVLLRRPEVHHHVARCRRWRALDQVEGGDPWVGIEGEPEGGGATVRDGLAVGPDVLGDARHRARRRPPRPARPAPWQRATRGRCCAGRCRRCRTGPHRAPGSRCSGTRSRTASRTSCSRCR